MKVEVVMVKKKSQLVSDKQFNMTQTYFNGETKSSLCSPPGFPGEKKPSGEVGELLLEGSVLCIQLSGTLRLFSFLYLQFDRWSDRQRREVLQDLVLGCSVEQLRFLCVRVSRQLPLQAADFTCLLPRTLCLYIFSFLDPRSLSRCAQVLGMERFIVQVLFRYSSFLLFPNMSYRGTERKEGSDRYR